jgi:hypothetical protein
MQQSSECGQCSQGDQNDPVEMFQQGLQQHTTYSFMLILALASNGQSSWLWLWTFYDFP